MSENLGQIKKAAIAVAGFGTRFLPATKCVPKEMLPIVDKPIIQYLVEEAVESGIEEIFLVVRETGQEVMENHFLPKADLEENLEKNGKLELLEKIRKIDKMAKFHFIKQTKDLPYGNASPLIPFDQYLEENERFVYMFGDDMVLSQTPCTKQIIDYSDKKEGSVVVGVQEVPKEEVNRYGIYKLQEGTEDKIIDAEEKPDPNSINPPYLAQFGRFVLNKKIVQITKNNWRENKLGKSNELWMIDQIIQYAKDNPVYSAKVEGEWLTTGDPIRYMKTQVKYALQRDDMKEEFSKFLKSLNL